MSLLLEDEKQCGIVYKKVFNLIYEHYINYCKNWLLKNPSKNLKRTKICDIYNQDIGLDKEFENIMDSYMENLDDLYFEILENVSTIFENYPDLKFHIRIKMKESILGKIRNKNCSQNGTFPLKDCLNDLIACRIIDSNYKANEYNIKNTLENLKKNEYNIKNMDRDNKGYKAHHIYFKYNNNTFPFEIQIWNGDDESNNIKLHKAHKQYYIKEYIEEYSDFR